MRKFTWFILAVNTLFLLWIIAAVAGSGGQDCGSLTQEQCDSAAGVGTAIGVGIIVVFWAFVDVILGVIWLITNNRKGE